MFKSCCLLIVRLVTSICQCNDSGTPVGVPHMGSDLVVTLTDRGRLVLRNTVRPTFPIERTCLKNRDPLHFASHVHSSTSHVPRGINAFSGFLTSAAAKVAAEPLNFRYPSARVFSPNRRTGRSQSREPETRVLPLLLHAVIVASKLVSNVSGLDLHYAPIYTSSHAIDDATRRRSGPSELPT
jgi:hypothetical protein